MNQISRPIAVHPQIQHRILLEAKGVRDAIKAVDAASAEREGLSVRRVAEHQEWRRQAVKRALEPGFDPGPEPPMQVTRDEHRALEAKVAKARAALALVVAANGGDILDGVRDREEELLRDVRAAVATLDGAVTELQRLGRAVSTVAQVLGLPGFGIQPRPTFDDLVKAVRKRGEDGGGVLSIPDVEAGRG